MNKHTPAPWQASWHGTTHFSQIEIWSSSHPVCIIATSNTNPNKDANLIAAAPELLSALEFLVAAADTEPGMNIYKAHIAAARAAIKKAKGE